MPSAIRERPHFIPRVRIRERVGAANPRRSQLPSPSPSAPAGLAALRGGASPLTQQRFFVFRPKSACACCGVVLFVRAIWVCWTVCEFICSWTKYFFLSTSENSLCGLPRSSHQIHGHVYGARTCLRSILVLLLLSVRVRSRRGLSSVLAVGQMTNACATSGSQIPR